MGTTKRSISFDPELLVAAERAARDEPYAGNLSRFVNEAVDRQLKLRGLAALVDEYEREFGAFGEEELAEIDRQWPG